MRSVPEFIALGGEASFSETQRAALDDVRHSTTIHYTEVRALKQAALAAAYDRFLDVEWRGDTARAQELRGFLEREAWWLEDYAIFRALHQRERERPWTAWPEPLRLCEPAAVEQARRELAREVLFRQYLQWIASTQWAEARKAAGGIQLFGDVPFMVNRDSVDAAFESRIVLICAGCRYAWEPLEDGTDERLRAIAWGCPECGDWLYLG